MEAARKEGQTIAALNAQRTGSIVAWLARETYFGRFGPAAVARVVDTGTGPPGRTGRTSYASAFSVRPPPYNPTGKGRSPKGARAGRE